MEPLDHRIRSEEERLLKRQDPTICRHHDHGTDLHSRCAEIALPTERVQLPGGLEESIMPENLRKYNSSPLHVKNGIPGSVQSSAQFGTHEDPGRCLERRTQEPSMGNVQEAPY